MHTYIHIDGDWVGKTFQCKGNKNTQESHYKEYLPNIIQSEPKWRRITGRKAPSSVSRKRIPPLKNVSLSWKVKPWGSLQGRSQKNKMGTSSVNLGAALQSDRRQTPEEICSTWYFSQEGGDGPEIRRPKESKENRDHQNYKWSPLTIQGLYAKQYLFERQKQRGSPKTKHITRLEPGFSGFHLCAHCSLLTHFLSCCPFPQNSSANYCCCCCCRH